ncbi:winged helix-turn-helix domain-containing protein [Pseudaestuariivita sp.]|uniref:winged helix-turn-helix domain-containing protein n=1 Tax=Pseudaestuariivita sp. TaxID=2211669 RepID=UPI00405842C4
MSVPILDNRSARAHFLHAHALAEAPTGGTDPASLHALIHRLGFVQVDSVRTVERAHDMILFARRPAYRPRHLPRVIEKERLLFEHWTHDAAVIPVDFFALWRLKFARDAARISAKWDDWRGPEYKALLDRVYAFAETHGACNADDLGTTATKGGGWWNWQPEKTALEYLWRSGKLTICHRTNFRKHYDVTERVLPGPASTPNLTPEETIDRLNWLALERLSFATSGEIAAFWDIVTPQEAKAWVQHNLRTGALREADITLNDGSLRRVVSVPDLPDRDPPQVTQRMRVLSPFDPALRDRKRAERLFGFSYRIEIFVPAPKRTYGYYVFPLLEGDRLVGRIDMKTNRDTDSLHVTALWPEPPVRWTKARQTKLETALARTARFTGVSGVTFADNWLRAPILA